MCRLAEGEHDSQGTVLSELVDSLRTLLSSRCKYRNFLRGLQEKTHNSLNLPLQKLDCSGKVVIFAIVMGTGTWGEVRSVPAARATTHATST